jgi:hypothetical protein
MGGTVGKPPPPYKNRPPPTQNDLKNACAGISPNLQPLISGISPNLQPVTHVLPEGSTYTTPRLSHRIPQSDVTRLSYIGADFSPNAHARFKLHSA